MSFFKMEVSAVALAHRLSDLDSIMSRQLELAIEQIDRSGVGQKVYEAMKHKTGNLVTFSIEFAMKTNLREKELDAVTNSVFLLGNAEYYWTRFNDIPDMRTWQRASVEPMMVGNAFQETCGSTGNPVGDDIMRCFGRDTFLKVYELAKKELKSVRIRT